MEPDLSTTANLIGDPVRIAILVSLLNGGALPAGELARIANVAPQTASGHLARLVQGRFLNVERQGRHRYYRLAGDEVASAIEALLVLAGRPRPGEKGANVKRASPGSLSYARTCYSHLAGWVGVRIADSLEEQGLLLSPDTKAYTITADGRHWFAALGLKISGSDFDRPRTAIRCLDWTERRHHIAGTLGCALYRRFTELRWMTRIRDTRAVRLTDEGRSQLWRLLRVPIG
jgi:DNA-binding transcriptional ArsR family regulator